MKIKGKGKGKKKEYQSTASSGMTMINKLKVEHVSSKGFMCRGNKSKTRIETGKPMKAEEVKRNYEKENEEDSLIGQFTPI